MNRLNNLNNTNTATLADLHVAINEAGITFATLSTEEVNTIISTFGMNATKEQADALKLPLTESGFAYICKVAEEAAIQMAVNEINNNQGGNNMNTANTTTNEAISNAIHVAMSNIARAKESVKVNAGMDAEEFRDQADEAINTIKNATCGVLEMLDHLVGATNLKNTLHSILYRNINDKSSKRGFFDAARECRATVERQIKVIMAFNPDQEKLKTVASLRYLIGQDENGNPQYEYQSIFAAFAKAIVWICKKVVRKLRAWFGVNAETNVFGSVGAGIASVFGVAAGLIVSVIKVVASAVLFISSYALSAVLHVISFVWDSLKKGGAFIKSKLTKKDEEEDAADEVIIEAEEVAEAC